MTKLLVFGNGLGRAINDQYFNLQRVLYKSWNDENLLTEEQKTLILSCLPGREVVDNDGPPTSEDELSDLQLVLSACDTIRQFEKRVPEGHTRWLTDIGNGFPVAIRQYIHHAASCFYDSGYILPEDFSNSLRDFVSSTGSTIATLNYDDLLYETFTGTEIFTRYTLRDGFFGGAFDFERAKRLRAPEREGWFLHLHGSPLFVTGQAGPTKIGRNQIADFRGTESTHLVLTNVDAKRSIINGSEILSTYWNEFGEELTSSEEVILIGYAGSDKHLNDLVSAKLREGSSIRIVEFFEFNFYNDEERMIFWKSKFATRHHENISVLREESILDFRDW